MMKTGQLIRIGLLFISSLIILFWGINFLKGKSLFKTEKVYYAEYSKIGGLSESSPVTVSGLTVGKVDEISLSNFRDGKILVKFMISYPDLELPLGSVAKIASTDLMGTKAIELILGDSLEYYAYHDTLTGAVERDLKDEVNTQMLPLKQSAENLMSSMDSVLVSLQLIFGPSNRDNLAESVESVTQTIKNLEKSTVFIDSYVKSEAEKLSYILSNADSISRSLNNRSGELHQIINNLAVFSDTLKQIPLNDISSKLSLVLSDLHAVLYNIVQGEGSLGKLNTDESLYDNLLSATENLNSLIEDIKLNPKRYVHISAFDRGKTFIASNDSELLTAMNRNADLEYYVCLNSFDSEVYDNNAISEVYINMDKVVTEGKVYYYIKKTRNFDQARKLLSKYIPEYPNSGLYTWLNGQFHKIEL